MLVGLPFHCQVQVQVRLTVLTQPSSFTVDMRHYTYHSNTNTLNLKSLRDSLQHPGLLSANLILHQRSIITSTILQSLHSSLQNDLKFAG